jgi:hypothetical protein
MTTEEVQLKHKLTDKEMAALAREQSEYLQAKQVAESEFESIRTVYKAKITEAQAKVQGISAQVQSGFEIRNVRCMLANERPEGYRLTIRLDTGHIARRRKLETEERQIKLTEVHDPFVAVAILPVDDETWEAEFYQCPVRQDEFDALRQLPDVKMSDLKPVRGQIEGPKGKKDK